MGVTCSRSLAVVEIDPWRLCSTFHAVGSAADLRSTLLHVLFESLPKLDTEVSAVAVRAGVLCTLWICGFPPPEK